MCRIGDKFQFRGAARVRNPVMVESALEVDNLLQRCMVAFGLYDLVVFEFTREQEADIIVNKLKGISTGRWNFGSHP